MTSLNAAPGTQFTLSIVTVLEAINAIQSRLTVVESSKQSGMITLTLTGDDPGKTATVLNTIAENFLSQNIARQKLKIPVASRSYRISYLKSVANWMKPRRD